jgi:Na+/H+ antiporter NhaD/arsenite permease-like protein
MGSHQLNVGNPADVLHFVSKDGPFLLAVSLGSVFFGAGTYLGNGPNFMVKAICNRAGVSTPGFVGYLLRYTLPFLAPILVLVGWLMVRW